MKLLRPTAEEGAAGLRAMTTVARARGEIADSTRSLINAAQKMLIGTSEQIDDLEPITPEELAAAVERPEIRNQLINGMVVTTMSASDPPQEQSEAVRSFANALHVDGPQLSTIEKLTKHDLLLFKLCVLRNGHLPDAVRDEYRHHGFWGVVKGFMGLKGIREDKKVADTFRAWEKLPKDSLGAYVFRHYRENSFAFPGEKGGFPAAGMYHDFSHVLAGYNTTPQGETLVGGFTAGYRDKRADQGLFTALFVLSIFSAGVDVTPIGVGSWSGTVGDVAEQFLIAIQRGSVLNTDLSDDWNFWEYIEVPLEEMRERLGVPPKTESGPGDYPF